MPEETLQRKSPIRYWLLISLICLSLPVSLQSQEDTGLYRLNWKMDAPLAIGGLGLNIAGYALTQSLHPRTELEIQHLSPPRLLKIDEKATHFYNSSADRASDFMTAGSLLLPVSLMADKDIRQDAKRISALLSETALLTHGLTLVSKRLALRDRPYVFNPEIPVADKLTAKSRLSFFSGHTSLTAAFSFFTAQVWSDYHPESGWKPAIWTTAAVVPAATGYLRYKSGKHYLTDVAVGYVVGAAIGYFVPRLHKPKLSSGRKIRFYSSLRDEVPVFAIKYSW